MIKLQKSTKILIVLSAAAVILATVLILTMPEPWAGHFSSGEFLQKGPGAHFILEKGEETLHSAGRFHRGKGHFKPVFPILLIGITTFLIVGRKGHHYRRKNNSKTILDQQFAEGKINKEEYSRKKTVIEEGDK